jgi:hypothetical protein
MHKTIALALAAFVAANFYLAATDGNAASKKKSKPTETTSQGVSPTLREQAKSQSNSVGGKNGCTAWHNATGAPC